MICDFKSFIQWVVKGACDHVFLDFILPFTICVVPEHPSYIYSNLQNIGESFTHSKLYITTHKTILHCYSEHQKSILSVNNTLHSRHRKYIHIPYIMCALCPFKIICLMLRHSTMLLLLLNSRCESLTFLCKQPHGCQVITFLEFKDSGCFLHDKQAPLRLLLQPFTCQHNTLVHFRSDRAVLQSKHTHTWYIATL